MSGFMEGVGNWAKGNPLSAKVLELQSRIEQLERKLAERIEQVGGICDDWAVADRNLESAINELTAEKALADMLIVAAANALQGDPRRDKGLADAWDDACAVYRKARGL